MGNGASKYLAEISWDVLDEDLKAYAGAKVAGTIKGAGGRLVKVNELAGAQERSVSLEVYPDDVIDVQINASSYGGGTSETERLTYTVSMIGEYLAPVTSLTASAGLGDVVLSLTYPDTLVNIKDATIYHAEVPLDYAGDGSEYNHTTQGTIIGNVSFPINTFTHSNVTYANRHLYWVVLNGYNGEYSPVYPSPTALVVDAQETTVLEVEGLLAETSDAFEINLNGAIIPRTKLTWNAPADQTTFQYVIDYKESENAIWERAGSTQTELFYIQGLDPLKLYDIRVKSVLVNGIASAGMEILNYKPATTSATASDYLPYPVTGLEIEKAATDVLSAPNEFLGNEVKFRWRPSSPYAYEIGSETFGADSGMLDPLFSFYEVKIFHPGDPVEKRTESVIDPHYLYTYEKNVDDGLSRDITISVRSVDKHGRRSEARILNVVNPLPQTPNVTFAPGIRFMTISYDKPADVDFKGIVVYGSTASEFVADDTTKLYEGNDATVMINGLEPSTQYFFRIAAFDAFGKDEMVVSAELTATTASLKSQDLDKTPPTTPTDLALSSSVLSAGLSTQSSLSATWTASTDDGFVSGYIVEYWNDADPATVYEKQVATNLFATSDVTSGATYSVRVCAIDWAGNKSEFTPANAVTIAGDTVAPAAITGLVMIPGLSKITVAWDKPAESDFLYVEAYIGTSAGFNVATAVRAYKGMATSFVYEDDSGVAKWVKVRAVDASGNVSAFVEAGPAAGFKIASANVERYFESAAIGNAYISELDAEKITTGFLNAERIQAKSVTTDKLNVLKLSAISADLGEVTAGVVTGAIVRTAASGARVQLDSISGIRGYNSASQETFGVNVDGSGFLGATATKITWDSNGNIQIPGELVAGNLIGNFISTSENALAEWRVDLGDEAYPIRYWDGVNPASTNFSVDTNGNVFVKGAIEITTPSVGYANFTDAPVGVADYANNTQAAIEDTTTITGGGITMSSGGLLKSASANLSTNNGILLGYSGSTYQFLAGNSASGKHIKFDGTDLTVNAGNFSLDGAGNMTATNATISGTLTGATLATSTTGKRTIIDGLGEMTMYNTANELMLTIGVDDATSLTTNWDSDITTVATDEIVISLLRGNPGFNVKYGMFVSSLLNAHTGIVSRAVYGGVAGVGGTYGTQGRGVDASGIGVHGIADGASGKGVVGQGAGYDFYASGAGANYGPFTGAHDGLVQDTLAVEIGDIVCDKRFVSAKNVSNTLFEVELSSSDSLPAIGVVAVEKSDMIPAALTTSEVVDEEVVTTGELPAGFATVQFNAVGEGMINVCGENGDIANGDLIITSSTPGKGMKQLDSVVHNYTVAKARGDWTFETPDEIRMIPCIYLCG
jgi:hypothetical protein